MQQFLAAWGQRERPAKHTGQAHDTLPAPYELAALRGEGVLRERFFTHFMAKLPVELDATQQLALWQTMVEDGGQITAWVQRLGIAKALRREAALPEHANQASRKLYTLLLDTLHHQAPELLPWAAEAYFWHCWKQQFPDSPSTPERKATQAEVLREQLVRALRKHHGEAVEVKESFKETADMVMFSLMSKRPSAPHWATMVSVERPRLKSARLSAYEEALSFLRD